MIDKTIFFPKHSYKESPVSEKIKIMGEVVSIEERKDKNNKTFYSLMVLEKSETEPVRWNVFDVRIVKNLKVKDKIVLTGVYSFPNKRMVKHIKILGVEK